MISGMLNAHDGSGRPWTASSTEDSLGPHSLTPLHWQTPSPPATTVPTIPHKHVDYPTSAAALHPRLVHFLDTQQAKMEIQLILNETKEHLSQQTINKLAKWKVGENMGGDDEHDNGIEKSREA